MSLDLDSLLADLGAARGERRDEMDRYRDFRQVLLGSDAGKRVLHDILGWGHMYRSSVVPQNMEMTYVREGERNLALKILMALDREPKPRPTRQQNREEEN